VRVDFFSELEKSRDGSAQIDPCDRTQQIKSRLRFDDEMKLRSRFARFERPLHLQPLKRTALKIAANAEAFSMHPLPRKLFVRDAKSAEARFADHARAAFCIFFCDGPIRDLAQAEQSIHAIGVDQERPHVRCARREDHQSLGAQRLHALHSTTAC